MTTPDEHGQPVERDRDRDTELVRRVADGDRDAKLELIERMWPRVEAIARHLSPFPEEVEDLVHEALLAILEGVPTFRGGGPLRAWADVVAVRTIRHGLRRIYRRRSHHVPLLMEPAGGDRGVEAHARQNRVADCVSRLLYRLPPDQRLALVLKLHQGHSVREVAGLMGRTEWSVRYLLAQGRRRMRKLARRDPRVRELLMEDVR